MTGRLRMSSVRDEAAELRAAIQAGDVTRAQEIVRLLAEAKAAVCIDVTNGSAGENYVDNGQITVCVKFEDQHCSGASASIDVPVTSTIATLKKKIYERFAFPPEVQQCIVGKRIVNDTDSLKSCGIGSSGNELFVYLRNAATIGLTRRDNTSPVPRGLRLSSDTPAISASPGLVTSNPTSPSGPSPIIVENSFASVAAITTESSSLDAAASTCLAFPSAPYAEQSNFSHDPFSEVGTAIGHQATNPAVVLPSVDYNEYWPVDQPAIDSAPVRPRAAEPEENDEDADVGQLWACAFCTFLNHSLLVECEICGIPHQRDQLVPREFGADHRMAVLRGGQRESWNQGMNRRDTEWGKGDGQWENWDQTLGGRDIRYFGLQSRESDERSWGGREQEESSATGWNPSVFERGGEDYGGGGGFYDGVHERFRDRGGGGWPEGVDVRHKARLASIGGQDELDYVLDDIRIDGDDENWARRLSYRDTAVLASNKRPWSPGREAGFAASAVRHMEAKAHEHPGFMQSQRIRAIDTSIPQHDEQQQCSSLDLLQLLDEQQSGHPMGIPNTERVSTEMIGKNDEAQTVDIVTDEDLLNVKCPSVKCTTSAVYLHSNETTANMTPETSAAAETESITLQSMGNVVDIVQSTTGGELKDVDSLTHVVHADSIERLVGAASDSVQVGETTEMDGIERVTRGAGVVSIADGGDYSHLVAMVEHCDLVRNAEDFNCPICFDTYMRGQGVVLRECLHTFCFECLREHVRYAQNAVIVCPFDNRTYQCDRPITDRELRALVSSEVYEKHLARSSLQAECQTTNSYHCQSPNCPGWCTFDDDVNKFFCYQCRRENCLTCRAIHDGLDCMQYQKTMRGRANSGVGSMTLEQLLKFGDALKCMRCGVVIIKKDGCDWVRCTMCHLEICWVTKQPRWGPAGKGDLSGGCQCRSTSLYEKCHPDCNNCH